MCGSCGSLVVKMFHLSAASCQDAPSLGRESHFAFICVLMCVCGSLAVKMFPSFGGFLSRCSIFRQGESLCVCSSVNVWFMWLFGCHDVPSFGGFLSRCLGRESHFAFICA